MQKANWERNKIHSGNSTGDCIRRGCIQKERVGTVFISDKSIGKRILLAEDIQMAKNAGMNGHIAKPLDGEKMITVLKQCLADNSDVKIQEDL